MKLLLKNTESYSKTSQASEVLSGVCFTLSERIASPNQKFIVTVCTTHDEDSRVRRHFEHRYVEEKKLNADFSALIKEYDKSISLNKGGMPTQETYPPDTYEQYAIIGAFNTKVEASNYIEGLWNYILALFN